MKVVVTGGAGFIGSALIRKAMQITDWHIVNVDCLSYAGQLSNLEEVQDSARYTFAQIDIRNQQALRELIFLEQPDAILHLAAETHVDRSIDGPRAFLETNIDGTFNLLEVAKNYWLTLSGEKKQGFRFHHISTDEVYGTLGSEGHFHEETAYKPNSPYSASKAASDHLVHAWGETYGLPVIITNCSNNYGPYHFPEKLIPLVILNAIDEKPLPVYGNGKNVRDWLYVDDHAEALILVLSKAKAGSRYNIGGDAERTNLEVVTAICRILDEVLPRHGGESYTSLIQFVTDRPGHDFRYAIDASKIRRELAWQAKEPFESGLRKTVEWFLAHRDWSQRSKERYQQQRLGLKTGI